MVSLLVNFQVSWTKAPILGLCNWIPMFGPLRVSVSDRPNRKLAKESPVFSVCWGLFVSALENVYHPPAIWRWVVRSLVPSMPNLISCFPCNQLTVSPATYELSPLPAYLPPVGSKGTHPFKA